MEREESRKVIKGYLDVLETLLSRDIDEGDNILSQEEVEAIDAGAKALKAMQKIIPLGRRMARLAQEGQ